MKRVKNIALTLLISVMAATAHAGEGELSLFSYGFNVGDSKKVQKLTPPPREQQEYATRTLFTAADASEPVVFAFTEATPKKTGQRRLPRVFTFLKVGYSW